MVGVFQPWHLIVVLVIVMMVFGPGKLPELGKAIGDGFRELKRAGEDDKPRALPQRNECSMCGTGLPEAQPFCGSCGSPQARAA
jgi:sec-independent protein translocase protein TatA